MTFKGQTGGYHFFAVTGLDGTQYIEAGMGGMPFSEEFVAPSEGTYKYFCPPHQSQMHGIIMVVPASFDKNSPLARRSDSPTVRPSMSPSATPSMSPSTKSPSRSPSEAPSQDPTKQPSVSPSAGPHPPLTKEHIEKSYEHLCESKNDLSCLYAKICKDFEKIFESEEDANQRVAVQVRKQCIKLEMVR